jgi:hypothetical protein
MDPLFDDAHFGIMVLISGTCSLIRRCADCAIPMVP